MIFQLTLIVLCWWRSYSQYIPCGLQQCNGFTSGSSYKCWDHPSDEIIKAGGDELANWINCSEVLGPEWKVVTNAGWPTTNSAGAAITHHMDWCSDLWWNRGFNGFSYKKWLTSNPTLVNNKKCHNIVKKALCTFNVAPHDISGLPNRYAYTSDVDFGSSACKSVCTDLWEACDLYNETKAASYTHLAGLGCFTPQTKKRDIPNFPGPANGKISCWHLNGTIELPTNCSSYMGFECKNGGVWHPSCTGCLCKPGFGGADCGRCSSKREMWPHVNRSATDYGTGNQSGVYYAAAACSILSGLDQNAAPIGNGKLVHLNDSQCAEIETLRPIPVKIINGSSSGSGSGATPSSSPSTSSSNYTNHTKHQLNISHVEKQIFECSFDAGKGIMSAYTDAYLRVHYGIVASPDCFDDKVSDPWNSKNCDVQGNISLDIIKAQVPDKNAKWSNYYSPLGIQCSFSECSQGKRTECLNNHVPTDYVEPCLKCKHITCDCPPHSVQASQSFFGIDAVCFVTFLNPTLKPPAGVDSPTFIGCSRSTGECVASNPLLPQTFNMPKCYSSSCSEASPLPEPVIPTPWYLLFYLGIAVLTLIILISCLNALITGRFLTKKERKRRKAKMKQYLNLMSCTTDAASEEEKEEGQQPVHVINILDVGYSVGEKTLIKGMNMTVWSGTAINGIKPGVMAVMGPSGAGKTTFLDVISGRKDAGIVTGKVMLDGLQLNSRSRSKLFGYVMQEEPMVSCLTVRETLRFAADLRSRKRFDNKPSSSNYIHETTNRKDDIAAQFSFCTSPFCCCSCLCASCCSDRGDENDDVVRVIEMLSLSHVADVRVGSVSDRTLSGGERKRVSIGTELIVDPPVLLLDEPTTGLDSNSAMSVMEVLNNLVLVHSRIVVATIHQPRAAIWNRLGGVTVVSPLGTIVYTGPAKDAPNYFMLDGEPCRFDVNPADHIIDSVAEMSEPSLVEMTKACSTKFQSNPIREQLAVMQFNQGVVQPNLDASRSSRNSMSQCCILCGRTNRILFRDKTLIILQYIVPAIIGVGFGFVYRGITNDLKGIQNLAGSFFALQVFWCLVGTTALDTWNSDRSVVLRQLSSGYYRITPYYIAQGLNDIFFLRILPPIAFSLPFVMLTGQCNNLKDFSIFSCILVLTSTSFASICLSIGAILKTPRSANAVGVLVMIFSLIFGGLLVNRAVAHLDSKWYEYLYYFAPLSYSYEAMMVKVLRNANINFNPQGFNTNVKTDGSVWLANFGLNADNFNFDLIMLSGFTVVGFLLSLPLLAISHRRICAGECNGQNPEQDNDSCGHCCSKKNMKGAPSSATNNGSSNRSGRIRLSSSNIKLPLLDGASSNALGKGKGETKTHDVNRSNHVLSFTDVSATVAGRQILSNVHGEVNTKNDGVFAILGPSGAGKTSLLDIIAGRKNVGTFSGHICVDGVEFSSISKRKSIFGYVMQDETLVTDLSVRESLTFSASLRLCGTPNVKTGSSCCLPDVTSIVRQVLIDLKIDEIADSRIGTIHGDSRTRGISGGERKRVAIGMELVVNPPVLLLDEPTTGLDAAAAIAVMSLMHALVKKRNMIVMCTIHQPRSDVFHQFGKVMVLRPLSSSLGEAKNSLFYVGSPDNAFQWLESKGYTLPSYTNVADLLLDLVVADFNDGKQNGSTGVIKNLNNGDTLMSTGEDNTSIGNTHHSKPRLVPDPSSSKKYTSLSSVGSHGDHPNTLITPLDSGANSGSSKKNLSSNNNKNNIKNNSANDNFNNNPTIDTETSHEKAHDSSNGGNGYDSSGDSENASISSLELGAASQVSRKKCYCSCYWEMIVLIRLEVLKLARSPSTILVHIGVAVIMGVIIGFLYEDMQPDVYGTWNRFLGIFAEVTMFALLGLSAVGTWQNDRVRFLRERSSGYYGTLPYYLSKFFVDAFALRVLPVVLFVFCSYSLVGFEHHFNSTYINTEQFKNASQCAGGVVQHSGTCITDPLANTSNDQGAWGRSKWIQILMLSLTATSASAISSTVSAMSTDGKVGNFATVLIILVLIMFSGALVSNAAMPWYVGWLTYVSPFAFTFEAMTIGQFQDQCFLFNPTTMRALFTPGESGSIACVEVPGYIWLLQFGCTAVGHNVTWKNGYPSLDGLSDCEYTYSTIEKDIMVSIILLGCYMFLAIGLYGFCVRERR